MAGASFPSRFNSNKIQTIDDMRRGMGYKPTRGSSGPHLPGSRSTATSPPVQYSHTRTPMPAKVTTSPQSFSGASVGMPMPIQIPASASPNSVPAAAISSAIPQLIKYHLCGCPGWQRIFGNDRATDVQPIQLIQAGQIHALAFSHAGTTVIPPGPIYLCRNLDPSTIDPATLRHSSSVIGTITVLHPIDAVLNFTLYQGERNSHAVWDVIPHDLKRDDRLSLHAPNLTGASLDLYLSYTLP